MGVITRIARVLSSAACVISGGFQLHVLFHVCQLNLNPQREQMPNVALRKIMWMCDSPGGLVQPAVTALRFHGDTEEGLPLQDFPL